MKQIHIILLVTLGFFLIPSITFACGKHSGNHACKKERTSKTEKDDCCKDKSHSGKSHDGCGGKCGHSACGCASGTSLGVTFLKQPELHKDLLVFHAEKPMFYSSESGISSGFFSIWLIPKIS